MTQPTGAAGGACWLLLRLKRGSSMAAVVATHILSTQYGGV